MDNFAHLVWGADKPLLILTDNKSLTRFFQAKTVPASSWNAVDHVLSFRFVLGHIPRRANLAADDLSRLPIESSEKLTLLLRDRLPIMEVCVELKAQTPEVDSQQEENDYLEDEYQNLYSFTELDEHNSHELTSLTKFYYTTQLSALAQSNPLDTMDLSDRLAPLNISQEQNTETISLVKRWLLNEAPINTLHSNEDTKKYIKQLPRVVLQNNVLYRKFFDQTGASFILHICVPKHLQQEIIFRSHNTKFRSHNGIAKTLQDFRLKFYFPGYHEFIVDYIKNCLT